MKWEVRNNKNPQGPGDNIFSKDNVEIGEEILLKIKDGICSEVFTDATYGLYELQLSKTHLPKNVILGVFLYEDDEHEVDVEFGRWGKLINFNVQLVNQKPLKISRSFTFKNNHTVRFLYQKDKIVVYCDGFTKEYQVSLNKPKLHLNLWYYGEKTGEASVILRKFLKGG